MQNRYIGDVGDFAKYSFLNSMSEGRSLGVAWYLYPDEGHNGDGKHIAYLDDPAEWRGKDPIVFDRLLDLVRTGQRSVAALEASGACAAQAYHAEPLAYENSSSTKRAAWRSAWFQTALSDLKECDVIFCDPDNGLRLDDTYRPFNRKMWKSIPVREAKALAESRTVILYHHNSRFKGGHVAEIDFWMKELDASFAVRARAYSGRTFFVVNARDGMMRTAQDWCARFGPKYQLVMPK
ncbi:MAG: hypothetical protein JXJ18_03320 [Rhodobacteraceae bacterium]|nr:hypothetical protein [Paracoccaceae bacterium]